MEFKGLPARDELIGETWELSAMPGRESVVSEGMETGMTLSQLVRHHGAELVGEDVRHRYGDTFPLLIKLIDAHRDLSIQVHPGEKMARERHGCLGKNEMWYILQADEHSLIRTGFNRPVSIEEFDHSLADGSILDIVNAVYSKPGDVFYIPAGQIHSIGAGNMLVEIQQSSDITYRVYDYNRIDTNGKPRELHTEQALEAIDFTVSSDCLRHYPNHKGETSLINSIFFDVHRIMVDDNHHLEMPHDAFLCLMCIAGHATIDCGNGELTDIKQGESYLAPACVRSLDFKGNATIITATV